MFTTQDVKAEKVYTIEENNFEVIKTLLIDYNNHLLDFKETLKSDKKAMKQKGMKEFIEAIDEKRKLIANYISYMQKKEE